MKTIGLLGGTSWPSTIEYYRRLNELAQEKLGGHHSANVLLYSIDYHKIKSRYHSRWGEIPDLLKRELERLIRLSPDCIIICNNTLHKALDLIESELAPDIPLFHIVDVTAEHAKKKKLKSLLLLGTQFTMEDGFFQRKLERYGFLVKTPEADDRIEIQQMQRALARGEMEKNFRDRFYKIISKHSHLDAVVLACTEIPLVVKQKDYNIPLLNPGELQCQNAFEYATNGTCDKKDNIKK
jgi:aspartate racemase